MKQDINTILALVDYATRHPEVIPLKKITRSTEVVDEALLDIYNRVGMPEEVQTE